ncbi:nickel/cobalt transporter [Chimaeribacter arupi]|uniref:nickel/cobalt transporter n=1 Tax=Chimaeribacter arupi TaxID=2060066 RepID=UPI000C7DC4BD|nr:nickel transporter [Chimaeribacter arupi]PLR44151.1 nickel transporter [Chimaeribacter arupi]
MKSLSLKNANPAALAMLATGALLLAAASALLSRYWPDFIQACLNAQIYLHRSLVLYLLQQHNHQASGGLMLTLCSFLYGVLHAVGPGHGKFVITTYLASHRQQLNTSRIITLLGSLTQGVTAILFVLVLAVLFNFSMGDLSRSRYWVEKISALLIAAFGLVVMLRAAGVNGRGSAQHDAGCGCGHSHPPDTGGKNALWVIAAIGIRPCSGAILILVFANALGMFTWGMIAVMAMALGTALAVTLLATLVHHARERIIAAPGGLAGRYLPPVARGVMMCGGALLMLFALVLFTSVIPVSANGDFIAAGC